MFQAPDHSLFSLLPQRRAPWREFALSTCVQGLVVGLAVWIAVLRLQVLIPTRDYHYVQMVSTPPPVNQEPAPVRVLKAPSVAELKPPTPETLRVTAPTVKPRVQPIAPTPPKIEIAARVAPPQPATPVIPKQLVKTNVFSTGSSQTPTTARAPQQVQTGGFGDPKGITERSNNREPVNIARLGSFDAPSGPGAGNGTAGSKGAPGVVASAGFGNGAATGDSGGNVNTSRGTVRQAGFGDTESPAAARPKPAETVARMTPAEILAKPNPTYTDEAKKLRIEGEVLLEVVFESSGKLRVLRVVRGLGHGLDENAIHAAEQIRFKPAVKDGQPADSSGVLHVVFQLA
ncbi:MAG TPA: TonB family protein [Terriglobales bacterium]|jgi:TonB family protein|nr:TonB family protein [Terriglobales bacterium]